MRDDSSRESLGPMHFHDQTFRSPAECLACDEAFLDAAEEQGGGPLLLFWEADRHFVVLGYANRAAEEANLETCREAGVPVLRRCSGGGTVLQGSGCLNYAVILRADSDPALASITGTNRFVMERNATAISGLLGQPVTIEGHTDLAVGPRKFSGNAQRRKRDWLLFHGTVLIDFDLSLIAKFLLHPTREPDYRSRRAHGEFVTNIPVERAALKAALRTAWNADKPLTEVPEARIQALVEERYSRDDWNLSR